MHKNPPLYRVRPNETGHVIQEHIDHPNGEWIVVEAFEGEDSEARATRRRWEILGVDPDVETAPPEVVAPTGEGRD